MKLLSAGRMRMWAGLCVVALLALLAGCAPQAAVSPTAPALPSAPSAADLRTPQAAIRSYLAWTTYAYAMADSDLATQTMSADESVRVDSYIEFNREKQRIISQALKSIAFGKPSLEGTRSIVATKEQWVYSYLSSATRASISPTYPISYDATYTLVQTRPGVWVVDHVDAKALGTVH